MDSSALHDKLLENSYLRALLNSLPDLVWLKDPEGVYMACNNLFCDYLGTDEAQIVGKTDYDFSNRDDADFYRHNDKQALNSETPVIIEQPLTFKSDGHTELYEVIKSVIYSADGSVIGVLGVGRNITRRKEVERNLAQAKERAELNEAKLNHIINETPFPKAAVDMATGEILFWSRSARELFGHLPSNVNEWYEMAYPDLNYREQVMISWNDAREMARKTKKTVCAGEYTVCRRNGSALICEMYVTILPDMMLVTINNIELGS